MQLVKKQMPPGGRALVARRRRISFVRRPFGRDSRSSMILELALVGPFFLFFLLFIFEVAYDQLEQEVLESTLEYSAHILAIGGTSTEVTQNVDSGATFVTSDFCPNDLGLLVCNNVYVRVQRYMPSATTGCYDIYGAVTGTLPASYSGGRWSVKLGNFVSPGNASPGGDSYGPPEGCMSYTSGSASAFCNAGPDETIIMTAIYVMPSFVTALLPNPYSYLYNGSFVRAPMAIQAFQTEGFTTATPDGTAVQC